jgi:hypothetical protein
MTIPAVNGLQTNGVRLTSAWLKLDPEPHLGTA